MIGAQAHEDPRRAGRGKAAHGEGPEVRVRRGEHARRRVLHAALELLAESGLAGFTMEAIARKAGASKTTLYRRWASPQALLVDAMDAQFQPIPAVSSGDLRGDLIAVLSQFTSVLASSPFPQLMAAFIDAAERDARLAQMHGELTHRRREPLLALLTAGVERGEIDSESDLELVVDLLSGPFFYRRFIAHRPIPLDLPAGVVDQVLASLNPPASPGARRHAVSRPARSRATPRGGN